MRLCTLADDIHVAATQAVSYMQPRNRYIRVGWRGNGWSPLPCVRNRPAVLTGATCMASRVAQIGVFIPTPTDALHLKLAPYNPARERQSKNGGGLEGVPVAGRRPANGVGMLLFVWSIVALPLGFHTNSRMY